MSEVVRVGILGFAHGHVHSYADVWRARPELGVRTVAGWDADAARAAEACGRNGIEQAATAGALLARPDVDAVVVASETSFHADLACRAAAAGKAVILQKPMALTLADADRIVAAVARAGTPFTLAWQMRVDPHNLKMKELLADGRFGRVLMARRRHCLPVHLWKDFENTWHVDPRYNRDIFADDAAHPVDFMLWLLGMPRSVFAELGTLGNPKIVNDNAIAVFRYADGAFAEISCSFAAPAGETTAEIVCEHGVIIGNYGDLVSCMNPRPPGGIQLKWYHRDDGRWTIPDLPDVPDQGVRIRGLAEPLAGFLHGRRPPIATAEEGRQALRMILACYESAAQGKRIVLD